MSTAESYLPILVLLIIAAAVGGLFIFLSWFIGPKKITPYKQSIYECGVEPIGNARENFPVKFYLVAMLFILFDIEIVFLWSWLTVFKNGPPHFQLYSFGAVAIYMFLWIIGDAYVLKSNAIDWDDAVMVPGNLGGEKKN